MDDFELFLNSNSKYTATCSFIRLFDSELNTLTDAQFNQLIVKLSKGKSTGILNCAYQYCGYYVRNVYQENYKPANILEKISNLRLLTQKQMDALINSAVAIGLQNYSWINTQETKGYKLTEKQMKILLANGYKQNLGTLQEHGSILTLDVMCMSLNLHQHLITFETLINKNNSKITNSHIKLILLHNYSNFDIIIKKIIELGFVPDNETVDIIISAQNMSVANLIKIFQIIINDNLVLNDDNFFTALSISLLPSTIDTFFMFNWKPTNKSLKKIIAFSTGTKIFVTIQNILACINKNVKFAPFEDIDLQNIGEMLSYHGVYSVTNAEINYNVLIDILNTKCDTAIDWYQLITRVLNKGKYAEYLNALYSQDKKPTVLTLHFACTHNIIDLFDFCVDKGVDIDDTCLYYSAKHIDCIILEKLIDMKILPDENTMIYAIHMNNGIGAKKLLENGASITPNVWESLIGTKFIPRFALDVSDHIEQNENLILELCSKYNHYPPDFLGKFQYKKELVELRKMCLTDTMTNIQNYKNTHGLEFDKQCYDKMLKLYDSDRQLVIKDGIGSGKYKIDFNSIIALEGAYERSFIYGLFRRHIKR